MKDVYTKEEVIDLVSKATAYQSIWSLTRNHKHPDAVCHETAMRVAKLQWKSRLDVAEVIIKIVENIQ